MVRRVFFFAFLGPSPRHTFLRYFYVSCPASGVWVPIKFLYLHGVATRFRVTVDSDGEMMTPSRPEMTASSQFGTFLRSKNRRPGREGVPYHHHPCLVCREMSAGVMRAASGLFVFLCPFFFFFFFFFCLGGKEAKMKEQTLFVGVIPQTTPYFCHERHELAHLASA